MTRTLVLLAALVIGPGLPASLPGAPQRPASGNATPAAPSNTTPAAPSNATPAGPANATPAGPAAPSVDPARVDFTSDAGMLLVAVKPGKTGDYEEAIAALHAALHASDDPERRAVAEGWVVYRAAEPDAKGNALYVHLVRSPVAGADYRPSRLLDQALADAPEDLLLRYRDSFAVPPTKLSLTVLADLGTEPPANATPSGPSPANGTPSGPAGPAAPSGAANGTPTGPVAPGARR